MVCKNCGKENLDTSEYCMYCKQKLDNKIVNSDTNKVEINKKNLN